MNLRAIIEIILAVAFLGILAGIVTAIGAVAVSVRSLAGAVDSLVRRRLDVEVELSTHINPIDVQLKPVEISNRRGALEVELKPIEISVSKG
jgi:hypothetical protein